MAVSLIENCHTFVSPAWVHTNASQTTIVLTCPEQLGRNPLRRASATTRSPSRDEGYRATDAIEMMRNLRSPYVLENKTFERYLLSNTPTNATTAAASSEPAP